jgi:hypothetical protein
MGGSKVHGFRGSKVQGSEVQGSEVQRFRVQRFRVQRFRGSEVQRFRVQRFRVSGVPPFAFQATEGRQPSRRQKNDRFNQKRNSGKEEEL